MQDEGLHDEPGLHLWEGIQGCRELPCLDGGMRLEEPARLVLPRARHEHSYPAGARARRVELLTGVEVLDEREDGRVDAAFGGAVPPREGCALLEVESHGRHAMPRQSAARCLLRLASGLACRCRSWRDGCAEFPALDELLHVLDEIIGICVKLLELLA